MATGNPVLPDISESDANALAAGGPHAGTGIKPIPSGTSKTDSPKLHTLLQQQVFHLMELLEGVNQGRVYPLSGLNVGCFELKYSIGATEYAYPGDTTFALTASETNWLYLDTDAVLKKSIGGWPAGDHVKLAKAVCGGSSITSIEDSRAKNYRIGGTENWWEFLPTAAVANKRTTDRNTHDMTVFEDDNSTPRITRQVQEIDADTQGVVPI